MLEQQQLQAHLRASSKVSLKGGCYTQASIVLIACIVLQGPPHALAEDAEYEQSL